jgi:hypothetical protein
MRREEVIAFKHGENGKAISLFRMRREEAIVF